ncbi:DNA mismatch repair protein MutS, partial [Elusimicrobiota bacterium]
LKVGYNKVFGYYIEITHLHAEKVPEDYIRKQTLVNAERFITQELKEREDAILGAEEKKHTLEYRIFCRLRDMVTSESSSILKNAEIIAELDMLYSFASVSKKNMFVKPQVGDWNEIQISGGRHPVVEMNLGPNEFIPNDTCLDKDLNQILIITGPNMAGKSTYLKQLATIIVMAQIGCFVPADSARIGVVDRIFTRIGAGENLAGGESTFMVEMTEVAAILNNASARSLLILDEVGRGTSTFDGISIAWSAIEAITKIGARTVFATHYFELTELAGYNEKIKNFNFAVREWKDKHKIVFLRKLQEGSADKSYGIHCAELAGVPKSVIKRAWDIFHTLEEEQLLENGALKAVPGEEIPAQLSLFTDNEYDLFKRRIMEIDLNTISPLELFGIVQKWQENIDEN